jgi:molecular chaperone GrpE
MSPVQSDVQLTAENCETFVQEISDLLRQNFTLSQSLRDQSQQQKSENEILFLELLEVVDAMDALIKYSTSSNPIDNTHPSTLAKPPGTGIVITKSLKSIQKKTIGILAKRQVTAIELPEDKLNFETCRVVDQEVRPDLPPQTVVQVMRQGFRSGDRILRPTEVIISK